MRIYRPNNVTLYSRSDARSRLWNEFVQRYHYFGYKPLPGAQLRYFVRTADGLLVAPARLCCRSLEDRPA